MASVEYAGTLCELQENESVLDGLLRAGENIPYSCKAGSCGSCLMQATTRGAIPARAQMGLKDAWKAVGYFLACVCHPEQDMVAAPVGAETKIAAAIASIDRLSDTVLRVRLVTESPFEYRAGQYLTLFRDSLARSYSIASLPADGALELHVRVLPNGRMSQWLASEAHPGAELHIQGPSGDCFYLAGREDQPLVLAGTGTGLAPIYGIARDALRHGHRGPMHLVHGAATTAGLYLQDELAELARAHANFTYATTVLADGDAIDQVVVTRFPNAQGHRVFLCGDPAIVKVLKRKLFIAGAALNDIHADAFLPSA